MGNLQPSRNAKPVRLVNLAVGLMLVSFVGCQAISYRRDLDCTAHVARTTPLEELSGSHTDGDSPLSDRPLQAQNVESLPRPNSAAEELPEGQREGRTGNIETPEEIETPATAGRENGKPAGSNIKKRGWKVRLAGAWKWVNIPHWKITGRVRRMLTVPPEDHEHAVTPHPRFHPVPTHPVFHPPTESATLPTISDREGVQEASVDNPLREAGWRPAKR